MLAETTASCAGWRRPRRQRIGLAPALHSDGLADVAQLVEHFTRNEGVRGSNPRVGFVEHLEMRVFAWVARRPRGRECKQTANEQDTRLSRCEFRRSTRLRRSDARPHFGLPQRCLLRPTQMLRYRQIDIGRKCRNFVIGCDMVLSTLGKEQI